MSGPIRDVVVERKASFSFDGMYRYSLTRRWDYGDSCCTFVMLNPSTADAELDDPTIRRCVDFARKWGHDLLCVVNLYAFRATKPADMWRAADPVGPANNAHIRTACEIADQVVLAWGAKPRARKRIDEVLDLLDDLKTGCLAITKDGYPQHPLFVPGDTRTRLYPPS